MHGEGAVVVYEDPETGDAKVTTIHRRRRAVKKKKKKQSLGSPHPFVNAGKAPGKRTSSAVVAAIDDALESRPYKKTADEQTGLIHEPPFFFAILQRYRQLRAPAGKNHRTDASRWGEKILVFD
jgi:hypothetical protein